MTNIYLTIGGLGLGVIEIEQIIKAINLFISLHNTNTPMAYLLKESLKFMQIELDLDQALSSLELLLHYVS